MHQSVLFEWVVRKGVMAHTMLHRFLTHVPIGHAKSSATPLNGSLRCLNLNTSLTTNDFSSENERRLMSISYCTSNDDRLEIDETTSNKRMEDLSDKYEKHMKL